MEPRKAKTTNSVGVRNRNRRSARLPNVKCTELAEKHFGFAASMYIHELVWSEKKCEEML
jgi:hypothetical protein